MITMPNYLREILMTIGLKGMSFADWLNSKFSDLFTIGYEGSQAEITQAYDTPLEYLSPRQRALMPSDQTMAVVQCIHCEWQGVLSDTDTIPSKWEWDDDIDACPVCDDGGSLYYLGVLAQGHTQLALPWSGGARNCQTKN